LPAPIWPKSLSANNRRRKPPGCAAPNVTESVCPYCAVGCGQLIYTKGGQIIDIEGDPRSPINEGTLCPKGANAFQLAVNQHRVTQVLYRAPHSDRWETRSLDWAMEQIARRVKDARDADFKVHNAEGQTRQLRDELWNAGRRHHRQRGELPDQEALRRRARRGLDRKPGANMT
jgi:formate dehydrogenase major subunit